MEDTETQELIQENIRLTRENNRLLKKLWRAEVTGIWGKLLFYALIIGVPLFVYQYYLQGYMQQVRNTYDTMRGAAEQVKNLPSVDELPAAIISRFRE